MVICDDMDLGEGNSRIGEEGNAVIIYYIRVHTLVSFLLLCQQKQKPNLRNVTSEEWLALESSSRGLPTEG